MGQIKSKSFGYIKWYIITNLHDAVPLSFLFDPFYWLGQSCSEIIRPLVIIHVR